MSVVLVDWLGRGGIAQCTEAWAIECQRAGQDPIVVTRPGRPLAASREGTEAAGGEVGRLRSHARVASSAAAAIRAEHPSAVVVQNYVVPALERPLYRAITEVGAKLILVIHDHQLHSISSGTRLGLRKIVRAADVVLAHTEFVGRELARWAGRRVEVVPHPLQLGMLGHEGEGWPFDPPPVGSTALHLGILRRRYKGSGVVVSLAARGVADWEFALIGVGAAPPGPHLYSYDGFVSDATIVRAVRASEAVLLPYGRASQSGAVVLAQALGSVVVASGVGGIPEQIEDEKTGVLIEPGATVADWASVLERLSDGEERKRITEAAHAAVMNQHERFRSAMLELLP